MANLDYTTIENGYDKNLERSDSLIGGVDVSSVVQGHSDPTPQVDTTITSGKELGDIWVKNWLKSLNYKPGAYGFMIDGKSGNVEFGNGYFRGDITGASGTFSGTITATVGSIGGWTISASAIYKDGATADVSSGFAPADYPFYAGAKYADRATAPIRVTPAGAVTASNMTITGGTIQWSIVAGTTNAPANNATVGATFGLNISGGSTSTNYVNNSGYITALTGNSITTGTLNASLCNVTNISASNINTGTLTGITITGGTIQTSSGITKRIVISSNQMLVYNDSNAVVGTIEGATGVGTSISFTVGEFAILNSNFMVFAYDGSFPAGTITAQVADIGIDISGSGREELRLITANSGSNGGSIAFYPETDQNVITSRPIIPTTAYAQGVGTATAPFSTMYATTYYFDRSGYAEKYIQMSADGSSIDTNHNFYVGGTLSKSAGSFRIDHPLKPETHYLQHSFIESPDMLNLYRNNDEIMDGECFVKMPDWFIPLNGKNKDDYSYQLTSIGQQNDLWVEQEMNEHGEVVFAGRKNGKFSYMITAIRHDKYAEENRIKIEIKK